MMTAIAITTTASERLIQRGDSTHHQDQVITLVSLRPTNNTVKAPVKLIPPEDEEDEEDIVLERDCLIAFCSIRSISLLIFYDNQSLKGETITRGSTYTGLVFPVPLGSVHITQVPSALSGENRPFGSACGSVAPVVPTYFSGLVY